MLLSKPVCSEREDVDRRKDLESSYRIDPGAVLAELILIRFLSDLVGEASATVALVLALFIGSAT